MKNDNLLNALDDLDQAFEGLDIQPLSQEELVRVTGGTAGAGCTGGFTCNWKCGPTQYWECPSDWTTCLAGTSKGSVDLY